jgi:hypothetical protein
VLPRPAAVAACQRDAPAAPARKDPGLVVGLLNVLTGNIVLANTESTENERKIADIIF